MGFAYTPPFPERREDESFRKFWARYPRRTAKFDAQKAYQKALTLATEQEILDGVDRYIANKPDYADWSYPASWLNKGRWLDEYDTIKAVKRPQTLQLVEQPVTTSWMDDCQAEHQGSCGGSLSVHLARIAKAG